MDTRQTLVRTFVVRLCSSLVLAMLTAGTASAGTYTIPAGSGTVSYTETTTSVQCSYFYINHIVYGTDYHYTYSGFSYKVAGVTTPLTGGTTVDVGNGEGSCVSFSLAVWLTSTTIDVHFIPAEPTGGSVDQFGYAGWTNPKYKVVDIMYAPPGSKSTATYGSNTVVGSSTMFSSSFSTGISESIKVSGGFSLYGFTDKQTTTDSSSYTQEEDTSGSVAVSQTTSNTSGITGYSDPTYGLNHDYDYIFVWVNPLVLFTLYETTGGTQTSVVWGGYGYDLNDLGDYPDMDIPGIELGCLNGNFYAQYENGTNQNWLTCEDVFNNNFNRSWALTNTDGSGPALTPTLANSAPPYNFCAQKGTDLYAICQADPFSNASYGTGEFPPPAGSNTTADGRFTACSNSECNVAILYEPNLTKGYTQGYSTTQTQSEGYKNTYSTSFSIESEFGLSGGKCENYCASFSIDTNDTTTYTWIDQFSQSTNNSSSQTSSFSIVGPAEGYTGPTQFVVYQDNLYGTFLFYPGN
jgi:hypothetical protein